MCSPVPTIGSWATWLVLASAVPGQGPHTPAKPPDLAARARSLVEKMQTEKDAHKRLGYVRVLGDIAPQTAGNDAAIAAIDELLGELKWKVIGDEGKLLRSQLLAAVIRVDVRSRMHTALTNEELIDILREPEAGMNRACTRHVTFGFGGTDARTCAAELIAARRTKASVCLPALREVLGETLELRDWCLTLAADAKGAARPPHEHQAEQLTREAIPALARAITAVAPDDRRAALAYGCIAADDPDATVRRAAAMRVGTFGKDGAVAVAMLVNALSDPDARVVAEAVTALGMIGPAAGKALPDLEKLAEHEDAQIRARVAAAVKQIRERRP